MQVELRVEVYPRIQLSSGRHPHEHTYIHILTHTHTYRHIALRTPFMGCCTLLSNDLESAIVQSVRIGLDFGFSSVILCYGRCWPTKNFECCDLTLHPRSWAAFHLTLEFSTLFFSIYILAPSLHATHMLMYMCIGTLPATFHYGVAMVLKRSFA